MMSTNPNDTDPIDPELLRVLVCPLTRSPLKQAGNELVGTVGGLRYPIRDGVPILLIEEARMPEGVTDLEAFKHRFADQIPQLTPGPVPDP